MRSETNIKYNISSNLKQDSFLNRVWNPIKMDWQLYLLLVPGFTLVFVFCYIPMYGITIAFKDYNLFKGFMGSPWVGLKHFEMFMSSYYFWGLIRNTLKISITAFVFNFPAPIILALLLNELKNKFFKRTVQTISYFPHFVSTVVVIGMLFQFTSPSTGIVNQIIKALGGQPINFMMEANWFVPMYVITGIWQGIGWGSIIYLAGLSSIDQQQYEAAIVDGASRFKQIIHISIPGILPTIMIMLILAIGSLMSVSFEKVLLMYNELIYEETDVLNTYIYRTGITNGQYSYSTAIGFFQTVINSSLIVVSNFLSKKYTQASLW